MEKDTSSPAEVTEELMQQILREGVKDNSIVVLPDLEVKEMNEDLHGGSCLRRVTVKYTRQGDTSHHTLTLLVKTEPRKGPLTSSIHQSTLFLRETQMFKEILPRMSTLLSRALPDSHTDFSARVFYTRKTPSYLIALEDLSVKGFKAQKRKNGLDLKHCLLAFRTLARFHAASLMIQRENEDLFTVFDKYSFQEDSVKENMKKITGMFVPAITQAVESWPEFGRGWADRVRQRFQTLNEDLARLQTRDDGAFNVLNHGDFGVHNVMYRHSETSGEVEAIMLVDFQCCSYISPVLDLHQFIFGSASDDVRMNHIDTLLREYHFELRATLEALGYPKDQIITLSQLRNEFNNKMLYGFFYTTCFLPFLTLDLSTRPDVTSDDIFNVDDGIEKMQSYVSDSYLTSFRELLPVFSQNKVL